MLAWEHRTEPRASRQVFLGRVARPRAGVLGLVLATLGVGVIGYTRVSDLNLVNSFLEASMFLSGAGPIYTQASSTDELKLFSSVYALFSTLVVVTSVAVLAIPIVHRVIHRLHINRKKNR